MNEEDFKKGIRGLQNIRLTDEEKSKMLDRIFSAPIKSPFMKKVPIFSFIYSTHHTRSIAIAGLVALLSFGGVVSASERSLPGDLFYPIKINVVESVFDKVNRTPEKKAKWEEKKVTRRIAEAEQLVEKNQLDDPRLEALEREIQQGSTAFINAINAIPTSSQPSLISSEQRTEDLKQEFRRKISDHNSYLDQGGEENRATEPDPRTGEVVEAEQVESNKIERLRSTALKVLDEDSRSKGLMTEEEDENDEIREDSNDEEEIILEEIEVKTEVNMELDSTIKLKVSRRV